MQITLRIVPIFACMLGREGSLRQQAAGKQAEARRGQKPRFSDQTNLIFNLLGHSKKNFIADCRFDLVTAALDKKQYCSVSAVGIRHLFPAVGRAGGEKADGRKEGSPGAPQLWVTCDVRRDRSQNSIFK